MDIPLNADVHCQDGRCGRSTFIILNPATETITHLVVREQWPSRTERLVPVEWVATSTRDVIVLSKTRDVFSSADPFVETDFVYTDVPHHAQDPKLTLVWPYVVPAKRIVDEKLRRVPPGELAVRRGARVRATDGRVGQVDEFVVDENCHISHLMLREGHLWGHRNVAIPVGNIERIEEGLVHLNLDKNAIEALPAVNVERRW